MLRRPEAKTDALVIEVAFDGKSHMDAFVSEGYPNFSWVALSGQDNINSVTKRREVLEVARKLHKTGSSVLVWLRLPSISAPNSSPILAEGNVGSVYDSKKFNKSWASFVDLSSGFDAIKADYVATASRHDGPFDHERVRKWMKAHVMQGGWFDACRLNFEYQSGLVARSSTAIASNVESIVNGFASLRCRDRDTHMKCRSSDRPYSLQIGEKLLKHYNEHCTNNVTKTISAVAARSQATQHPALFRFRLADAMTSSHFEEITAVEAEERAQEFRLALQDPDRLADTLAGLTKPAAFRDISKFIREPKPEDDPHAPFLRCIPNGEWLDLRKEYPRDRWTTLYEIWHTERGVKVTGEEQASGPLVQDTSLAGWLGDLIKFPP